VFEQRRALGSIVEAAAYIDLFCRRGRGSARELRWLVRMAGEYPVSAMSAALSEALRYGMTDLERLERMVLRRIGSDFFVLPRRADDDDPENNDDR